ncbi:MAG: fused MFS/spermidine synthase [Bacteroidia bacterium]
MQILSSVILTPYWGNSFVFWSLQLFFVMLALAAGYYISFSRQKNIQTRISEALLLFTGYSSLLFIFSDSICIFLISHISSPIAGTSISLLFFVFCPLFFLARIPLLVIEYQNKARKDHEGRISGFALGISSVSGILAVILLAFIALPNLGLNYSILLLLLIFTSVQLYFLKSLKTSKSVFLPAFFFLLAFCVLIAKEKNVSMNHMANKKIRIVEEQNGILGQLKVIENIPLQTKFLYVNNSLQSKTHFTGRSLYPYLYSLVMYASYKPPGSNVLIAGMGAGSLAYEFSKLKYNVDVVDIDNRLLGIARRNFLLPEKKLNFIESDIRRFIKKNNKPYDVIVFDLSKGESVPTNVYTLESFRECKRSLNKDGILLIHFLSSMSQEGKMALASVKKTVKEAGFKCEIMNRMNQQNIMSGVTNPEKPEGYLLLAYTNVDYSNVNFVIDSSLIKELIPDKNKLFLSFDDSNGQILSDDRPILDVLQNNNATLMRKQNIKTLLEVNKYAK